MVQVPIFVMKIALQVARDRRLVRGFFVTTFEIQSSNCEDPQESYGQSTENGQCGGQSHYDAGEACRMGRVEVYNPSARHANGAGTGTWGTVCGTSAHVWLCCWLPPLTCLDTSFAGHYFWDNTEMANVVCRQLGFPNGFIYTFGRTHLLPTLPIVAGFRTCQGMESNIFQCAEGGNPLDRDCWIGCRGADGQSGTADDVKE